MPGLTRDRESDIALLESLLALLTTNEELAVQAMQRIRAGVLQARVFMDELREVFAEVQSSRAELIDSQGQAPVKSWRLYRPHAVKRTPKVLTVLLSAQARQPSDTILREVFEAFIRSVQERRGDILLVGKVGRDMFHEAQLNLPYQYADWPRGKMGTAAVTQLSRLLFGYDEVMVFYGKFVNLVHQTPNAAWLAHNPLLTTAARTESREIVRFIFEPSPQEVARVFDEQVAGALVAQMMSEGELAQLGSRITALEQSQQVVQGQLAAAVRQTRLLERARANREQADRMAGMALWYA